MRRGKAHRATAHDGHAVWQFLSRAPPWFAGVARLRPIALGQKPLESANRDGLVDGPAPASRLAGVRANPAADAGHRVRIARIAICFFKLPLRDERDVTACVGLRRASHHARKIRVQPVAIDLLVTKTREHDVGFETVGAIW